MTYGNLHNCMAKGMTNEVPQPLESVVCTFDPYRNRCNQSIKAIPMNQPNQLSLSFGLETLAPTI